MPASRSITIDLLYECAQKNQNRPKNGEAKEKFIARQTHLHLEQKKLKSSVLPATVTLPLLTRCYMFDNEIDVLEGLGALSQLTYLYCQNNSIHTIGSDIGSLRKLKKLYLNGNCLASLEKLAPLTGLEELHVASQRVPEGATFDPAPVVLASMHQLRVLDLANNGLTTTECLVGCQSLQVLSLARNQLASLESLAPLLTSTTLLIELDLSGNGVSDTRHNLDEVVIKLRGLSKLNGREIASSERAYLASLHQMGKRRVE